MSKIILTDADGVLFNWETAFHNWMQQRGYDRVDHGAYYIHERYSNVTREAGWGLVKEFNNSAWIAFLPTLNDARTGIAALVDLGYKFHCITSLSTDEFSQKLRMQNLCSHFGDDAFEELICLDTGQDKDIALKKYEGSNLFWIEDKPKNCDAGLKYGLRSIIIDHLYNRDYNNPNVIRVTSWGEIVKLVKGENT